MKLFTLHDKAIGTYSNPVAIPSNRDAIESLRASVADPNSAHSKHAPDFTLYCIGEFDQFTGVIKTYAEKELVTHAASLKLEAKNDTGITTSN